MYIMFFFIFLTKNNLKYFFKQSLGGCLKRYKFEIGLCDFITILKAAHYIPYGLYPAVQLLEMIATHPDICSRFWPNRVSASAGPGKYLRSPQPRPTA
jgi:hypothetical protein